MQSVAPVVVASPASATSAHATRPHYLVRSPQREASQPEGYWPCNFLHAFTLQMAAHGHCVCASMMLGNGSYAMEQLTHARGLEDETLQELAEQLAEYFSTPLVGMRMSFRDVGGHRHDDALA